MTYLGSSILTAIWSLVTSAEDATQASRAEDDVQVLARTLQRESSLSDTFTGAVGQLNAERRALGRMQAGIRNPLITSALIGGGVLLTVFILSRKRS